MSGKLPIQSSYRLHKGETPRLKGPRNCLGVRVTVLNGITTDEYAYSDGNSIKWVRRDQIPAYELDAFKGMVSRKLTAKNLPIPKDFAKCKTESDVKTLCQDSWLAIFPPKKKN
jgi:hypothetical protein